MKTTYFKIILIFSFSLTKAQHGTVMDDLTLNSKILKSERKYAVYLPPDYENSRRSYPVLYLLHGYTDDHTGWVQFGEVLHIADKAIISGEATSIKEIVDYVFSYFQLDYKEFVTENTKLLRTGEPNEIVSNPIKINEEVGWKATTKLDEIIEKCISYKINIKD